MTPMRFVTMSPAIAALFGSLVGALGSSASTWITQRHADQRDLIARRIFYRVQLYSEFITESARVLVDALENNFKDPNKLIPAYALLNRIRLTAYQRGCSASAEGGLVREIVKNYSEPNLSPEEIRSRALNGNDPLRKFSETCRAELEFYARTPMSTRGGVGVIRLRLRIAVAVPVNRRLLRRVSLSWRT